MKSNKALANLSWLFVDKVIHIFGSLFIGVWVARYLGPSDYGLLNYAMAYVALFVLFVKLGLDQIVVRELVKNTRLTPYLLGTAFFLKSLGSLLGIAIIFVSLYFFEEDVLIRLVVGIIAIGFVLQAIDVVDFFYQSKVLSKYVVIARSSAFIIASLLNVYFIIYEYSVIYFAISNMAYGLFSAIFLTLIYRKTGNLISKWRFSPKIAKQLLIYSWPLAISIFLASVHMKVDQVMIGSMLGTEQVGIYSVAVKLAEFWIFFPGIIVSTLMPYFVKLRETDNDLYYSRMMQLYSLMFWMGAFVGIVAIVFGQGIILFMFGEAYMDAYDALVFNIWNGVFISQAMARGIWMISENLQKYKLYNNVIAVIVNVSANLMLIPAFGITGAAVATFITQALAVWVFSFLWAPLRASTLGMIKAINPIYLISFRRLS